MKKINLLLILILSINILLRIPALFDPVSYGDECIYLTLGNAFNKGLVFYRDIHDNKPPLLYIMAALANANLFWFRLIMIIWNTLNVWLVYKLAKKILKREFAGLIAAFLFVIFSLLPEGRIANGEIYMIMPATLGVLLALVAEEKKKNIFWLLSGFSFSIAFLFKVPIAFDFVGFLLAFFIFSKKKIKDVFVFVKDKRFWLTLTGFVSPIFLTIVYYTLKGAFTPYVRSALLQNVGYLSSWGGSNLGLYQRLVILIIATMLIYLWRQQLGLSFYLPALMAFWGLYGVFLSERPYPHYLIEIAPWAALLFTVLFYKRKPTQLIVAVLITFLTISGFIKFKFWWYPNIPYYQNFAKYAFGEISKDEYFRYFGDKTLHDYKISDYLKQEAEENDRVFIWGDGSCIYAILRRLPPGRYAANYHIFDFNGFEETIFAIKKRRPKIIIKLLEEKREFPRLERTLKRYYMPVGEIENAIVFQKI